MSNKVSLRPHNFIPYTLVPNFFIDEFLPKAHGEFIKVYLVLLRYMSVGQLDFDLSTIADHLLMTESDVLRALNYFSQEKLVTLTYEGNRLREIHLTHLQPKEPDYKGSYNEGSMYSGYNTQQATNGYQSDQPVNNYNKSQARGYHPEASNRYAADSAPAYKEPMAYNNKPQSYASNGFYEESATYGTQPVNDAQDDNESKRDLRLVHSKPDYTTKEIAVYAENEDFHQLLYIAQKYMGKTLSTGEVKTIISFHDWLGLPIDVIELLIEYCVGNDHRNMRYIEKVAIDWADNNINTLEKAKVRTETYNKSYFIILKAYGITDRSPTPKQVKLMDKWLNEYQFDLSIIVEACERTITQINKAEMRYTDSILNTWFKASVHTLSDVAKLDENRPEPKRQANNNRPKPVNKFNNYNQRDYDYDELERKALELRLRESGGKRYSS